MFSRWLTIIFISGLIFSCGLKVGEPVPNSDVVELRNTKCLNESIESLKLFLNGQAKDSEVDSSFKCFSQVLIAFKDNINGSHREFFAPEELAYFVEVNFLKGQRSFRTEFLAEIMKFKTVLVGGSKTVFYKNDIEQLAKLIDRIRPEIVRINPEMKIVSNHWNTTNLSDSDKEKQFLLAKQKMGQFFKILSAEFASSGEKYETNHFLNFIKELAIFAKSAPSTIEKIEKTRPFLINFKKHLVGAGTDIEPKDWNKITKSMHEMLFQLLRVNYFLTPLTESQSVEKWLVYQKISEDMLHLISILLEAQNKPELSNQQIYDLISSLLPIFSEQKIDIDLVQSFAEIKVALLGEKSSNSEKWVPADLNQINQKLPRLFSEIQKIITLYNEITYKSSLWNQSYTDFSRIETGFSKSIQGIFGLFDGEYNLNSLKTFLISIEKNNILHDFKLPKKFEGLFKVGVAAKYMLTGQQGSRLTNLQLKYLSGVAAKIIFHYFEYENYLKPVGLIDDQFYIAIDRILPKIKKTFEKVFNYKDSKDISLNEILSVFYNLKNEKIIETNISVDTMSSLLQVFLTNVLITPEARLGGKVLNGFDTEALNNLTSEIQIFSQSGHDTANIFGSDIGLQQKQILQRIEHQLHSSPSTIQTLTLNELQRVIDGPVPMTLDQNKFLKIFDFGLYKINDVLQIQISRTLSRLLIRSFSLDLLRAQVLTGFTLSEAETCFKSIKKLFFDLDLVSSDNTTFISSRFRETNLFVGHANGDQLANFEELSDLIIHIFSGIERAAVLRRDAVQKCLPLQNEPVTGATAVSEDCLLQHYFDTNHGFESMPKFSELKKQFSEEQNKNYYLSLLKAVGHIQNDKKIVYFDDANLFPHVAQYIEVIFMKYDLNQDGILDKDEALLAYPVFRNTIKEVLNTIKGGSLIPESQLPGVFLYLLKFGRPPSKPSEYFAFLGFISNEKKWIIESTRLDLGLIFNFITDALSKP